MKQQTQNQRILAHLKAGHRLTPLEALDRFGCMRLGARIWDLRQEGHDIRDRLVSRGGAHVAQYWLAYWPAGRQTMLVGSEEVPK